MLSRLGLLILVVASGLLPHTDIDGKYYVFVALESEDAVVLLEFDGTAVNEVRRIPVGYMPGEIEGPHGLALSPDGTHLFVSMAHGNPYGSVIKIRTDDHTQVGSVELGLFPATMAVSPASGLLFVSNFNLHGDHDPSTVSVVDPARMVELGRVQTGVMPHGGRFAPDGLIHYSVSMMDGKLHLIDASEMALLRSIALSPPGSAIVDAKPTWVSAHPDGKHVYVADNRNGRILEIATDTGSTVRSFDTPAGPYNLDISPDGTLLAVTYKTAGSIGLWDLRSGMERVHVPGTTPIPHGVVFAPDGRYVFVTTEGIGTTPGALDVIDVQSGEVVAAREIGSQPGGIVFWKKTASSDNPGSHHQPNDS